MKERLKKYAPIAGYLLFYFVCLVIFLVVTFPADVAKERIVVAFNAEQRATNGKKELKIDEASLSIRIGGNAKGIHLLMPAKDPEKPQVDFKIDEASARISLLSLLVGTKSVNYSASLLGGSVDGSFEEKTKERNLEVSLDGLDMSQIEPIKDTIGGPMDGKLGGKVSLQLPEQKVTKANGNIDLELKDMAIGDGKSKLFGMLALPRASLGNFVLNAEVKDGQAKITKLSAPGKDIELQGDGKIQLRDNPGDSILDMNLKFRVNDGYRGKSDATKSLFGAPGSTITPLIEALPPPNGLKGGKCNDGFYGVHVRGTLDHPVVEPNCGAVGVAKPAAKL
jgi:type II secretion system protein N